MKAAALAALSPVLLLLFAAHAEATPTVTNLRVVHDTGFVRVEITLTEPVTPVVKPPRALQQLVLVLPGAIWDQEQKQMPVGTNGVKDVRLRLHSADPPETDLVVEMEPNRAASHSLYAQGNKVVLEVNGESVTPATAAIMARNSELSSGSSAETKAVAAETSSSTAPEASSGSSANPRGGWIWQGSDDTPVTVKSKPARRLPFNPLTDTGLGLKVSGIANFGYSAQTQNLSPAYNNLDGGFTVNGSGFLYNPQFVAYQLTTSFDRNNSGYGSQDGTLTGLSYGGSVYLLQATPLPFSVSMTRTSNEAGGTLSTPFDLNSRSTEITGKVLRLPVDLAYHLGVGRSGTTTVDGYRSDYQYRSGDVVIAREWQNTKINIHDNYLRNVTEAQRQNGATSLDLTDRKQITNNLSATFLQNFGSRVTLLADGGLSNYQVGEAHPTQPTEANVPTEANLASVGAGVNWQVTDKLQTSFRAGYSRNAANVLQLVSASGGVPLPNPLPGVTVLDTISRTLTSTVSYRPDQHWSFGASANYNATELPPALVASAPAVGSLTTTLIAESAFTAYTHRVWKFDYTGSVSGGTQKYLNATAQDGTRQDGSGKVYGVSNSIVGGDENTLRYGLRFTIDRTRNPVFFSLLTTNERAVNLDLASHRAGFMHLTGNVNYSQREIQYAGSTQRLNGINFTAAASFSKLTLSASHSTSDTNQRFLALLNLVGSGTGTTPPPAGLLSPVVFSSTNNTTVAASWRARQNLRLESRYMRFGFTLTGQDNRNQESWFDNSVLYHFGRFDMIGGYVHATGDSGNYHRRMNHFYFRVVFPFQLW